MRPRAALKHLLAGIGQGVGNRTVSKYIHDPLVTPIIVGCVVERGQRKFDLHRPVVLTEIHRVMPIRMVDMTVVATLNKAQGLGQSIDGQGKVVDLGDAAGGGNKHLHAIALINIFGCVFFHEIHMGIHTFHAEIHPIFTRQDFQKGLIFRGFTANSLSCGKAGIFGDFIPNGFVHSAVQDDAVVGENFIVHFLPS